MKVKVKCQHCGKDFSVPHWRASIAKFCSRQCCDEHKIQPPNVRCEYCGKPFHLKPRRISRAKHLCCSRECSDNLRKETFKGVNNHQYGLRGCKNPTFIDGERNTPNNKLTETLVYVGEWYKKHTESGYRIKKHRYVVEKNWHLFDETFFEEIDGWHYLKDGVVIHHIDFNHNNHDISNLQPMTKSEHSSLHSRHQKKLRNSNGQFVKNDTRRISTEGT